MHKIRRALAVFLFGCLAFSCSLAAQPVKSASKDSSDKPSKPLVTFVELGSVNCIPCKKMQPVMKAIEHKYAGRVKVVFHDVWTDAGKSQSKEYKIRLIPTQVFLDAKGKEFFRHEGFYPEEEIHKLLAKHGIKPNA